MFNLFKTKKQKAINNIIAMGDREILNGQIHLEFFIWVRDNTPNITDKEKANMDLKIKQTQDIIKNNQDKKTSILKWLDLK